MLRVSVQKRVRLSLAVGMCDACAVSGAIRESFLKEVALYWTPFVSTRRFVLSAGHTK